MIPRHINASEIVKGDRVKIELPKNQGVMHTIEGVVHKIEISGGVTYYYSREGANILAWYPGISGVRILLIRRDEDTLFSADFWASNNDDIFAETNDRIA